MPYLAFPCWKKDRETHRYFRFHDENTLEEDLTHPEDIAHFAKHDKLEEEQERIEAIQKRNIVAENIPPMFRRGL